MIGVLEHRSIVRAAEVVSKLLWPNGFEDVGNRKHVAERFRHLLAAHGHPAVVQPVPAETIARGLALRAFVLVVRENQIQTTTMDIELRTEEGLGHSGAFEVPARTSAAPRRRPRGLSLLGRLPQREVTRIAFAHAGALALMNVIELVSRQCAVAREAQHIEVDVAFFRVRMPGCDESFDQLDHLGDMAGGARLGRGREHTELVVRPRERPLEGRGPFPPGPAGVARLVQDLVVDVGDVADEGDVVVLGGQPPAQDVECHSAANMADVRLTLHRCPAQVYRRVARDQGGEFPQGP